MASLKVQSEFDQRKGVGTQPIRAKAGDLQGTRERDLHGGPGTGPQEAAGDGNRELDH